jgi:hypothetical protein
MISKDVSSRAGVIGTLMRRIHALKMAIVMPEEVTLGIMYAAQMTS